MRGGGTPCGTPQWALYGLLTPWFSQQISVVLQHLGGDLYGSRLRFEGFVWLMKEI